MGMWRHNLVAPAGLALGALGGAITAYSQSGNLAPTAQGLIAATGGSVGAAVGLGGGLALDSFRRRHEAKLAAEASRAALMERLPLSLPSLNPGASVRVSAAINPDREISPYRGRGAAKGWLIDWCLDSQMACVAVLSGPAGVGKTRLTVELARNLPPEWFVGRPRADATLATLASVLTAAPGSSLLVIETPWQVHDLGLLLHDIRSRYRHRAEQGRIKILIVTRAATSITGLSFEDPVRLAGECISSAAHLTLAPEGTTDDRARWFAEAVTAYTKQTQHDTPPGHVNARMGSALSYAPIGRAKRKYPRALEGQDTTSGLIQAYAYAAAADLFDNQKQGPASPIAGASLQMVAAALAAHDIARRARPKFSISPELADLAVALLIMRAPKDVSVAANDLRALRELRDASEERVREVARWVSYVYPGKQSGSVAPPAPDLLAQALTIPHLLATPELRPAITHNLKLPEVARLVSLFAGAHETYPEAAPTLIQYIIDSTAGKAQVGNWSANDLLSALAGGESAHQSDLVLAELVQRCNLSLENLKALRAQINKYSSPYATVAVDRECVKHLSSLAANQPNRYSLDHATALRNLGCSLKRLGPSAEGLSSFEEAVRILRSLTKSHPQRYSKHLAKALRGWGVCLVELQQPEKSMDPLTESVALLRSLPPSRALAKALRSVAFALHDLGQNRKALIPLGEAVTLLETLSTAAPGKFDGELAEALRNMGDNLSHVGQANDSEPVLNRAVALHRSLVISEPDRYGDRLAATLQVLSSTLEELGREEEALPLVREEIEILRAFARRAPDRYSRNLAAGILNFGSILGGLGRHHDALVAHKEAEALLRSHATKQPARFEAGVAASVLYVAIDLSNLARHTEALPYYKQAVARHRMLAKREPNRYQGELASAVLNLGNGYAAVRRLKLALRTHSEAVADLRELAAGDPIRYSYNLAAGCLSVGNDFMRLGRYKEALSSFEEAVAIFSTLATNGSNVLGPTLALTRTHMRLARRALHLSDLGLAN